MINTECGRLGKINCWIMLLMVAFTITFMAVQAGAAVSEVSFMTEKIIDEDYEDNNAYSYQNKEILYLKNGYTIRIAGINKDVSSDKIWLVLEKNGVKLDDKIVDLGNEYSWHDNDDYITLNVEIFVGTRMNAVFFNNIYQISNSDTIIDNETFISIYSGGISGSSNLNTANNNNIEGFTALNENVLQSENFPPVSGYSQELLRENYSLVLQDLDIEGYQAWLVLYKNESPVEDLIMSVGDTYNYNSLISLKLHKGV